MSADDRLTELPAVTAGHSAVHLWHAELWERPGDGVAALVEPRDAVRLAALPRQDAVRLLARRSLLAGIVGEHLGCAPDRLRWRRVGEARTVAAPSGREVHVSLSSSGDLGLIAVSAGRVGVDLEQECDVPEASDVARLLLSESERAWIQAAPDHAAGGLADRFLQTWVRKEAVVKCTGTGLAGCDLRSFSVDASRPVASVVASADGYRHLRTVEVVLAGAMAAVAVAAPH